MSFEVLVGKKIVKISGDDCEVVAIDSDGVRHRFYAEGDCCSSSWFEHLEHLDILVGQVVSSVGDMLLPGIDNEDDYNYIQNYGWTIVCPVGTAEIEMRNRSNGYYGGYIEYSTSQV